MAFKVSSSRLITIVKILERAKFAINTLEVNSKNKIIFPDLNKDIQKEIDFLKVNYELEDFEEWKMKKTKINQE